MVVRLLLHTHLGEVIDERQVGLLQLGPRQRGQRVGVVQLLAVGGRQQVRVQADHVGGVCRATYRPGTPGDHSSSTHQTAGDPA